jgi:hypothetical protein
MRHSLSILFLTLFVQDRITGLIRTLCARSFPGSGDDADAAVPVGERGAATWAFERLSRCPALRAR